MNPPPSTLHLNAKPEAVLCNCQGEEQEVKWNPKPCLEYSSFDEAYMSNREMSVSSLLACHHPQNFQHGSKSLSLEAMWRRLGKNTTGCLHSGVASENLAAKTMPRKARKKKKKTQ